MDEEKVAISNLLDHRYHIGCDDLYRSNDTDDRLYIRWIDGLWWGYIDFCYDSLDYMFADRYLDEMSDSESIMPYLRSEVDVGIFRETMTERYDRDIHGMEYIENDQKRKEWGLFFAPEFEEIELSMEIIYIWSVFFFQVCYHTRKYYPSRVNDPISMIFVDVIVDMRSIVIKTPDKIGRELFFQRSDTWWIY